MKSFRKILAYIKITRPLNVVITFCVVVVSILISQKHSTEVSLIILASISAALVAAAGNIINDIYDVETDKMSHPERILPLGKLAKIEVKYEYLILNIISAIVSINLSHVLFWIVFMSAFLLFIYSAYLKKIPLISNTTVALLTGLAFIYGGYAVGNPEAGIIPAVFAFLINLIREIVKDIQDIEGDKKQNIITFPIKYGTQSAKSLATIFIIILIAFTFYPFLAHVYKVEYFIIVMVFVNPVFVFCVKNLLQKKDTNIVLLNKLLKLNMITGLIAIYFGH
jgi:geranylgeranylglycerol-phosphate geranylgeranyltransferase